MINTTVGKVVDAYAALSQLTNTPVDGDIAITISLNMGRFKETVEKFDERRKPLIDELVVLNPDGTVKEFKDRIKWDQETKRMTDVQIEISPVMFDLNRLKTIHGVTATQITMIEWLINFPKEEKSNDSVKEVV